jgi:hypothetical protein
MNNPVDWLILPFPTPARKDRIIGRTSAPTGQRQLKPENLSLLNPTDKSSSV